jgi:uncharacterized protein YjbJ (UPF0337 family)
MFKSIKRAFQTMIDDISGSIVVNGKRYKGKSVCIRNGVVTVDGVVQEVDMSQIPVNIVIEGSCGSIQNDVGDIKCGNVSGDVQNSVGDITCNDVTGDVTNSTGDINCKKIGGKATTSVGDIGV